MPGTLHENVPWTLVVPSDGASRLLAPLLAGASSAADRILVWTTDPGTLPDLPPVTILFDAERPKSITRWWLSAIEAAPTDVLVVCNDDVDPAPGYLTAFAAAFAASGATMGVVPGGYRGISGWCYALDRSHGVLPDPAYRWHVSDHDLYYRASLPPGRGVYAHPDPGIRHCKFRDAERTEMRAQVLRDLALARSRSSGRPG